MAHRALIGAIVVAAVAAGGWASAQTHPHATQHGQAPHQQAEQGSHGDSSVTVNIQGEHPEWWGNPYNYAFYGAAVAAFANGPDAVDREALDKAFMHVARDFALEMGADPAMMQDHLKLIAGQMIEIVREDPSVLDSYDNMMAALRGPE